MKYLVFSDSHGRVSELEKALFSEQYDAVIFLGDGVDVHAGLIGESCTVPYRFASPELRYQNAAAVAARAEAMGSAALVEAAAFAPEYLRQSQAERELNERSGSNE